MTKPDFRALCAELLQPLSEYDDANPYHEHCALITRARAALAQPEPQGPKSIYRYSPVTIAECGGPCEQGPEYCDCGEIKGEPEPQGPTGRPAIEPVPVAERLPGPEDCDAEGRCYAWDGYWWLVFSAVLEEDDTGAGDGYTHWLPHHALPVPQQEVE